jgi:hypothetical protein
MCALNVLLPHFKTLLANNSFFYLLHLPTGLRTSLPLHYIASTTGNRGMFFGLDRRISKLNRRRVVAAAVGGRSSRGGALWVKLDESEMIGKKERQKRKALVYKPA